MNKNKKLYKLFDKESKKTIGWFTDYDDMNYLMEWYDEDGDRTGYEKYQLVDVVE